MADPVLADARAYLAGFRGVTIFDHPDPRDPGCVACVIAGVRCYEVRASAGGGASAAHHLRDGEWFALAKGATVNGAFASIAEHVERIGHLPAWYSPETDAAVRAGAAEILVGAAPTLLVAREERPDADGLAPTFSCALAPFRDLTMPFCEITKWPLSPERMPGE